MTCCATPLRLQHGAGGRITYTPGRSFSFALQTPLLRIWQGERGSGSPLLTFGLTPTADGSAFEVAGTALRLTLEKEDVADLPVADDIFYDIVLTGVDGFTNAFLGGPVIIDADGSYGAIGEDGSVSVTLSGVEVPVVIQGGALAASASIAQSALDEAVAEASGSASDAEAAKSAAIAATVNKADKDGGNITDPTTFRGAINAASTTEVGARAAKAANLSDLADRTAALANLNFLSAIPGAVARTAAAKAGDFLTTADRQLAGDGATDDTAALQAAIAYAASVGKPLHILPAASYYKITAALTVPDNATLIGSGWKSRIVQTTANTNGLLVTGDDVRIDGVALQGLNDNGIAITGEGVKNLSVTNCLVKNWLRGIRAVDASLNVQIMGNRCWGGVGNGGNAGDIGVYGSGGNLRRVIMSGNFCLSNNDTGITCDNNDGDREVIIANNIVVPCDADGIAERPADNTCKLRFGISVGYNGGAETRAVVSGNVVRRAGYIGIYSQGAVAPSGTSAITGNMISECGFSTLYDPGDASLKGGIFLAEDGANTISGNVIVDCTSAGLKIAPALGKAADGPRSSVTGNTIGRTVGRGIWCTNKMYGYTFSGNRIFGGSTQAAVEWTSTDPATGGDCLFVGNHIETTGDKGAFQIVAAGVVSPVVIRGNKIYGSDNTTNDEFNSGVWTLGGSEDVIIDGNVIEKYHRAINLSTTSAARVVNGPKGNHAIDCPIGIYRPGVGPMFCQGNTFDTVTTKLFGAAYQGALLSDDNIVVSGAAAPTTGVWALGDRCQNSVPAVGQPKGWLCTVAGSPGTWISEGNL